MSEFTKEIRFLPAYDYRDNPEDDRGVHGVEIHFILRGPLGAVLGAVGTQWNARPLMGPYVPGQWRRARNIKPGIDHGNEDQSPRGYFITGHSPTPIEDWDKTGGRCTLNNTDACWTTIGYGIADGLVEALVTKGDRGVWRYLRKYYDEWFEKEAKSA